MNRARAALAAAVLALGLAAASVAYTANPNIPPKPNRTEAISNPMRIPASTVPQR